MINRLLMVMGMVSVTSCGPDEGQIGDTADTGFQYSGAEPLDGTEAARISCAHVVEIHDFDRDTYGREYCVVLGTNLPYFAARAGDCDDGDPAVHPGVADLAIDGVDYDCSGVDGVPSGPLYYRDLDLDGYGSAWSGTSTVLTAGFVVTNTDCDDTTLAIYPGAIEGCDGVDSNCDGNWDQNFGSQNWYRDADFDTYGSTTVYVLASVCAGPPGFISTGRDCNDNAAAVNPTATEVCDSMDNDCDSVVDESCSTNSTWYRDADGDGFGQTSQSVVASAQPVGYVLTPGDCNDGNPAISPSDPEVTNGVDDDCDGSIDEGGNNVTCYFDTDNDLFRTNVVIAVNNDTDCDDAGEANPNEPSGDCNDSNYAIKPGVPEIPNDGVDQNCNGNGDEGTSGTYYADADADGAGNPSITSSVAMAGYVFGNGTDCDDSNANRTPGRTETCDGMDNDCDYIIDEGVTGATWYRDADGDNYGSNTVTQQSCAMPTGYIATSGDCQDGNAAIRPNAPELCNSQDDDCDGIVDDNATGNTTWYRDADGDGYGATQNGTQTMCTAPSGYVSNVQDCDDNNGNRAPNRPEICDSVDNDCDYQVDENGSTTWYLDSDHDGYGLSNVSTQSCLMPANYASLSGDCDDVNANRAPNKSETCDNVDNDCDYQVDETCSTGTYWRDQDGDGYGNSSGGTSSYAQTGFASSANGTDCDDNNGNRSPGRTEVCSDNTDNDCDYQVDEGCTNNGTIWYLDVDGDGYGQTNLITTATSRPAGYAALSGDCNDANQNISPGDPEVASNNVDDDCDGSIDENGSNTTGLTREVCVIDAGTSYRLGFADVTPWDTSRFVSDSGSTAVVNNPILTYTGGATSADQCTTVTLSNAGTTLVFNGWGSNTGMWHDYLVGTCTGSSGATIERNSTLGKCATLRISVDSVINGVSDGSPEWAQLRSSDNNLSWTD